MEEQWLTIGKIVNTHGIRGEVKVWSETDFPEERFAKGKRLWLVHPENRAMQELVTVVNARLHKQVYIIKLQNFHELNHVLPFKGWFIKVKGDDKVPLRPNEYYFNEIIGCEVITDEMEKIGQVESILRPGANDVWVVQQTNGKLAYIPYIDDVVLSVDPARRIIVIRVMEGLLE